MLNRQDNQYLSSQLNSELGVTFNNTSSMRSSLLTMKNVNEELSKNSFQKVSNQILVARTRTKSISSEIF